MDEAILAFCVALDYANEQIEWYDYYADQKLYLFRAFGVAALLSSILATYFSATLSEENTNLWRFKRKNITAFLAAVATITVAVSGFFGWKSSWESHRTAQITIEALVVEAEVRKLKIRSNSDPEKMYELAEWLTQSVKGVVLAETSSFFKVIKDAELNIPGN